MAHSSLTRAFSLSPETDASLFQSRSLVQKWIASAGALDCCDYLKKALAAWDKWRDGRTPSNEAAFLGWLNVFAGVCSAQSRPCSTNCLNLLARDNGEFGPALLRILLAARANSALLVEILGNDQAIGEFNPEVWQGRQRHWRQTIEKAADDVLDRQPGQAIVMHVLRELLEVYSATLDVRSRSILNLLLVPLLRVAFSHADAAHTVYSRYFFAAEDEAAYAAFHELYRQELGRMEEFQSRSLGSRAEVLSGIRAKMEQHEDISRFVHGGLGKILHGSPGRKDTKVSQITFLIRDIEGAKKAGHVKYKTALEDQRHYRLEVDPHTSVPGENWRVVSANDERLKWFAGSVKERYDVGGYRMEFLQGLFPADGPGGTASLPTWVQDGEITFLWLLKAIHLAGEHVHQWIEGDFHLQLELTRKDIAGTEMPGESLQLGASLAEFWRIHALLFDADGSPLPKAWSLVNFLEGAAVTGTPASYAAGDWAGFVTTLFSRLSVDSKLTQDGFTGALAETIRECGGVQALPDPEGSRLPTYGLELINRDSDAAPYSLFFYPLAFERIAGACLPQAFVAGTFGGLEWSCFPSVTERQNYHLLIALDAARPILDHEIGSVLRNDQQRVAYLREKATEAKLRKQTLDAVMPPVRELSALFKSAQAHLYRIQSAVDSEWMGFFTTETYGAVADIFVEGASLPIPHAVPPEPRNLAGMHAMAGGILSPDVARTLLVHRLVFLAREAEGYRDQTPLTGDDGGAPSHWRREFTTGKLFERNLFLQCLYRGALEPAMDPHGLNLLLKLLTVDVCDVGRGLHLIQVAAALGLALNRPPGERQPLKTVQIATGNPKGTDGLITDPRCLEGIKGLLVLLRREAVQIGRNLEQLSTGRLKNYTELQNAVEPYRFLRALRVFGGDALRPTDEEHVVLRSASIEYGQDDESLLLTLDCDHLFSREAKLSLWNYQQRDAGDFHNLRSSFKVLCDATSHFPSFLDASSCKQAPVPSSIRPFLILEDETNGRTTVVLRLSRARGSKSEEAVDSPIL